LLLLRRLRRANPTLRIIVDLDDLMSRRYETMSREGLPLPLGYLRSMLPASISRLLLSTRIARIVLWYERMSLRRAEQEILRLADAVVLLNSTEAAMLQASAVGRGRAVRASITAIPPMARPRTRPEPAAPASSDWHAIFIGSDMFFHNRLAIDRLLDLWSAHRFKTRLCIYGRQKRRWPVVPCVELPGYVTDIAEAYKPGSFLVYPCAVAGGIKTKILEAFSYGVPVIANTLAFEGILPPGYPLVIDDSQGLIRFLQNPASRQADLTKAAEIGMAYLAREHSPDLFAARWHAVIDGSARRLAPDTASPQNRLGRLQQHSYIVPERAADRA
jgi:hypothetical protein